MNTGKVIRAIRLGPTCYKPVWDLQRDIFEGRVRGLGEDVLLLTEHFHVYTLGRGSDPDHLLAGGAELKQTGAEVYDVDRGGDITYHGPGQIVGYPILNLNDYYADIHRYLRDIEEVIIRTLSGFGIKSYREGGYTGVWAGGGKVAAVGVKVNRWITMHGFALNVNTDLSYFDRIIPCGIFHKGVTSMERIKGNMIPLEDVFNKVAENFGKVFGVNVVKSDLNDILHFTIHQRKIKIECEQ